MFPAILQSIQVKLHCGILPVTQAIWIRESGNQYNGILNPHCGIQNPRLSWIPLHWLILCIASRFTGYIYMLFQFQCIQGCMCSYKIPQTESIDITVMVVCHTLINIWKEKKSSNFREKGNIREAILQSNWTSTNRRVSKTAISLQLPPSWRAVLHWLLFTGAVSRNSAKLGNYKMPVKFRETLKQPLKTLKEG